MPRRYFVKNDPKPVTASGFDCGLRSRCEAVSGIFEIASLRCAPFAMTNNYIIGRLGNQMIGLWLRKEVRAGRDGMEI